MNRMIRLRDYQLGAILAVESKIQSGSKRPAVVIPTGGGKTVIFSALAARFHARTERPTLILVHREELADQALDKLRMAAPDLKVGLVKAESNDVDADLIVASVQTISQVRRLSQLPEPGLIIVDEAHHATAESYRRIMTWWDVPAVGFTATMIRGDGADLGDVWDLPAAYRMDILDMIPTFLVDVVGRQVTVDGLTLGQVQMRGRDFAPLSLGDALRTSEASTFITRAYREYAGDMPGIVFTPDVQTALDMSEAFVRAGFDAAPVWGDMDRDLRRRTLQRYENGDLQVLINCMVLTEGFDSPRAQCAVIARPTTSPGLYIQMVGRVLRQYPGKSRALVLDVVGASETFSLAGLPDLTGRRLEGVEPGESLLEAVQRERRSRNPNLSNYVVDTREVDLFHRSSLGWLETEGGVWFLSVPRGLIFLWPDKEPGRYRVGSVADSPGNRPRWHLHDVDLEFAMAWGEQTATEYMRVFEERAADSDAVRYWSLQKTANWRRRPATTPQINFALSLGVDLTPWISTTVATNYLIKRGEISDLISIKKASKILDRK